MWILIAPGLYVQHLGTSRAFEMNSFWIIHTSQRCFGWMKTVEDNLIQSLFVVIPVTPVTFVQGPEWGFFSADISVRSSRGITWPCLWGFWSYADCQWMSGWSSRWGNSKYAFHMLTNYLLYKKNSCQSSFATIFAENKPMQDESAISINPSAIHMQVLTAFLPTLFMSLSSPTKTQRHKGLLMKINGRGKLKPIHLLPCHNYRGACNESSILQRSNNKYGFIPDHSLSTSTQEETIVDL